MNTESLDTEPLDKESLNIESLEINILKASEIKEGDLVIVKMSNEHKSKLNKDDIKNLYQNISKMLKKEIPIYFFPEGLNIDIIKNAIKNQSSVQEQTNNQEYEEKNN